MGLASVYTTAKIRVWDQENEAERAIEKETKEKQIDLNIDRKWGTKMRSAEQSLLLVVSPSSYKNLGGPCTNTGPQFPSALNSLVLVFSTGQTLVSHHHCNASYNDSNLWLWREKTRKEDRKTWASYSFCDRQSRKYLRVKGWVNRVNEEWRKNTYRQTDPRTIFFFF